MELVRICLLACTALSSVTAHATQLATSELVTQAVEQLRRFDGVVEAVNRSTVSAQSAGRVEAVHFDVDDYVKKGDVLVEIRRTSQQVALESAEAKAREAQAQLDEAQSEFSRTEEIYAKQLVAKAKFDQAAAALKAARARLAVAQAGVAEASELLAQTTVRAPYSGIVTERHVEVGEMTTVGTPLMSGLSLEALRVEVKLPQSLAVTIRDHGRGEIELPSGEWLAATGLRFFPVADALGHTFRVRLQLPQGDHALLPGMYVKARFKVGSSQRLLLPESSVAYRGEVAGVYVVDKGQIVFRQVRLGRHYGERGIEVLAGVEPGERVALDPIAAGVALKQQGE